MTEKSLLKNIDWKLIFLLVLISIIGVFVIYSSSRYLPGNYFVRQIIFMLISLAVLFIFLTVNYRKLITYSLYIYIVLVGILVGILLFGRFIAGTKSWIRLPLFQVQPSELTKIAIVLVLAKVFASHKDRFVSRRRGLFGASLVLVPFILTAIQPDLGTALIFVVILAAALYLAGLRTKTVVILLVLAVILASLGWMFGLKDYQKKRITTLILPQKDPQGAGYHILQSKIAIGAGGMFGKGFQKGSQSQLRFLPARHTDFIFSVIGEEFGFAGVAVVLLLYIVFISRLFSSVKKSRDRGGVYIIFMVAVMISFQFFINVFMVIGFFPVAGIPLPMLSYGGSSLLTHYLAVSLVLNVKMRRFVNI
ncbi:MAG: rod shape-determining protein RodA [Candidatus Aminicenantes bacterium]|nr:rod shape-determining protein RodA [Candidatus Aminicenantes bacterium]